MLENYLTSRYCEKYNKGMEDTNNNIKIGNLIQDIRDALQDVFVAKIRRRGTELDMEFVNGQRFTLVLFENAPKNNG